eukprot:SAG31_NODE_1071_length_10069_cov_3.085356_2_plen_94_part_00
MGVLLRARCRHCLDVANTTSKSTEFHGASERDQLFGGRGEGLASTQQWWARVEGVRVVPVVGACEGGSCFGCRNDGAEWLDMFIYQSMNHLFV